MQARSRVAIEAITGAARARFVARGYAGTSIDEIAAAAGRTKGAVYHHFADKEAVFRAVFVAEQRRIAEVVIARADHDDPVESLRRGLAAYLALIAREPDAARITLVEAPVVLGWEAWRACDDGPFRAILAAAFDGIARAGRLRDGLDPAALAELVLGAVTEAALGVAGAADPAAAVEVRAAALRALVDGVTTPAGSSGADAQAAARR